MNRKDHWRSTSHRLVNGHNDNQVFNNLSMLYVLDPNASDFKLFLQEKVSPFGARVIHDVQFDAIAIECGTEDVKMAIHLAFNYRDSE